MRFLKSVYAGSLEDIDEEYQLAGYKQLLLSPPVDNVRNLVNATAAMSSVKHFGLTNFLRAKDVKGFPIEA